MKTDAAGNTILSVRPVSKLQKLHVKAKKRETNRMIQRIRMSTPCMRRHHWIALKKFLGHSCPVRPSGATILAEIAPRFNTNLLQKTEWALPDLAYVNDDELNSDFTLEELHTALHYLKTNRAPGVDDIPVEVFLTLEPEVLTALLAEFNSAL